MPSSSARCAQLPRAADKVPFYAALKKFRDYLKGVIPHIDEAECVFTEERIKQQCEQTNFKNQQNSTNSTAETYANTEGISNNESLIQNSSGYPFDSETNSHGAAGGGGPGPPANGSSASFMMSSLVGSQQEKKKRGRPKKIRGQEIIDPVTGNKIQVNNQLQSHGGDYSNILNLSVMQGGNCEMPKKKRGRPKKVKPPPTQHDILGQQETQSSMLALKPNIMSIQAMTGDITQDSPLRQHGPLQTSHQHVSTLYATPPHQRSIYSPMASPMASPSLNCSYTTNTPPSQPLHDKLGIGGNIGEHVKTNPTDLVQSNHHPLSDQHLGESPPPSSPNICTVDFDPPAAASIAPSSNVNERADTELNVMHQRLQNAHQRSRYNSPINTEVTSDHNTTEHFQHWLSPQHNHIHSPASARTTASFANSPQQQSSLHYNEQQHQQMQSLQQEQELHAQWPLRHQRRYEDAANSHYMLNSPQLHQTHQTHHHDHTNQNQNQHAGSDVARKSLSGLESLVDQIPTISESESVALSSAAAINAQAAAAAAVESRLQGMRNDHQVSDSHFVNSATIPNNLTASSSPTASGNSNNNQPQQSSSSNNLLSNNFSVSNLAASSASRNIINNHENYGLAGNTIPPTNANSYHHSNLMAAAVMAAAAANTPTNLSTSTAASATAAHPAQMYMDPHAHLTTHVPVNSLYPPPTSHHHPATAAHHAAAAAHHHAAAAAAHYGNGQHTSADYANNPYAAAAAAQSNVNAAHTLHMPSPNYPYGYATAASQSSYSGYPHSHASHHVHPHGHHTAHHLTMFDRLKPSDIGGYSGF